MNASIFKAYDIRGIYPTDLNEEAMESIIRSIYAFFKRDLKKDTVSVVLGRDMRTMGPALFEVAKKTLVACGAEVIDIDLVSTPTFYYSVLKYSYDAGIDITASHNPKEWAGIKFVKRDGNKIIKIGKSTGMNDIKEMALKGDFPEYTNDGTVTERTDVLDDEITDALETVDVSLLKKFKVACDPANGMGSLYVAKLFEKVGGELVTMNFDLDGTFPAHQADPLDFNNLIPLQDKVKEVKADFGIEPDGDGDRVFFIDEKGQVVPATFISSLIAQEILKEHPNETIVVDIRYTRNVSEVVKNNGGKIFVSKVGHAFITEDVNREGAYFAGESSGHFYFGETGGAESAVRVIIYILKALSESGKPLSELLSGLVSSYESGERNFVLPEGGDSKALMEEIVKEHEDGELSRLDGISIDYPDWRMSIRSSNTEPLLRLNVEAKSEELMKEKFQELTDRILQSGAKEKSSGH
jgi:phosphomannomutase